VAEEKKQETENMSWEEYYKELNNYAKELKYKDAIDMREDLLNRTTNYFIQGMEEDKINSLGGIEKATYSVKSVLKKLTVDTLKTADYGSYSPIFGEQLVNELYPQSVPYTREKIRTLLKDAEKNSFQIRQAAEYVRNNILQFERVEQYFISLFSFKYYLIPKKSIKKFTDLKKSKEKVYKFLESLRIKEQFPRITADVIKNGCGFYLFSKKGDMFDFLRLPIDQCRITGVRNTFGMCFEVDAFYFQRLYDLGMVTPEIYSYYKDLIESKMSPAEKDDNGKIRRDENGELRRRIGKSNERIFIPISPLHGCCITADPYKGTKLPLLSALLPDSLDILEYKNIQKQKSILETWCIIPQVIPYEEVEKPKVPLQLAKQTIAMLQSALPQGVVTFSTPLEVQNPITLQSSNTQENITGLGEQNFFSAVGIAGNIMGVGEAKNQAALDFSNLTDFGFVSYLYGQFDSIVNLLIMIYVNENDWKVKFFGNTYRHEKEVKDASSMFSTNNLPAEYLGANLGFEPQEFEYMLELGDKSKLKDLMKPLVSQFQQSSNQSVSTNSTKKNDSNSNASTDTGGRPELDSDELSDGGEQARQDETNANRKGM
jgi:hypothetical protein